MEFETMISAGTLSSRALTDNDNTVVVDDDDVDSTTYSVSWIAVNIGFAIPIVTSILSLIGSSIIVSILVRRRNNSFMKGLLTSERIILGMSCMDIISSFANTLATIPSPSHLDHEYHNMRFPGYGTTATCTVQGFFFHLGQIGTTLYYCALSIYYVMTIRSPMTDFTMKKKVEPFLHGVPIFYSLSTAIFLAITGNFNNATSVCWIAPYPIECRTDTSLCERGRYAFLYRWIFVGLPVILIFFIILTCMILLICFARKVNNKKNNNNSDDKKNKKKKKNAKTTDQQQQQDESITAKKSEENNSDDSNNHNHKHDDDALSSPPPNTATTTTATPSTSLSKKMTTQALLYIGAYFATFIFGIIFQLVYVITRRAIVALYLLQQVTAPAQGLFNFLVFIRSEMENVRRNTTTTIIDDTSFFGTFWEAIKGGGDNANGGDFNHEYYNPGSTIGITTQNENIVNTNTTTIVQHQQQEEI